MERRNVTLIYDDSGSMWYTEDPETGERIPGDNWKFANYALQSLTSLLGEHDELNVVRMSNQLSVDEINTSYETRQHEIERIAGWEERGQTPFDTVHTSLSHIRKSMEGNQEDDYWFIIVMDGAFNDLDYRVVDSSDQLSENYQDAYETLAGFKDEVEQQDISFQSIFVTMESFLTEDEIVQMARFKEEVWDTTLAGRHLRAETEQEIIDRINEVAALMTNRDPHGDEGDMTLNPQVSGNEVSLSSPYPLRRITILQQESGTSVQHGISKFSVNGNEGELSINGPFHIQSPYDPMELRDTVYGSISHVSQAGTVGVIPEGSYTMTFSEEVNKDEFEFIAEAALDFDITLKRIEPDGELSDNPDAFFYGSNMKMLVRFKERGHAGEILTFTSEEAASTFEVTATIHGEEYIFYWDPSLQAFATEFEMPEDGTIAIVTGLIEGFYQEDKEKPINGVPSRTWELQSDQSEWVYAIDELEEASPLYFSTYIDGRQITEEELSAIFNEIELKVEGGTIDLEMKQDGSRILIIAKGPRYPFMMSAGEREITLTVSGPYEGETASVSSTATVLDIPFMQKYGFYLLYFLALVLVIIYIYGVIRKNRFDRHSSLMETGRSQIINGRKLPPAIITNQFKTSFFTRYLVPYTPEKITIDGLTFKAGPTSDRILLTKESQQNEMRIGRTQLREDAGKQDITIYTNDQITRMIGHSEEFYRYYKIQGGEK